ncbi:regulator [Pararobbsia alpina]|uniref:Regulatory protein, RpfE type n=1 Tax=Pararobbsia alpina TaxID=621374 RepID=A0A6S7AZK7_9BURK|nr:regulator [Pararobbsia alpina]CAB3783152.1 hypothetical protein LMG28138_01582 [Pararobbsia alpina]
MPSEPLHLLIPFALVPTLDAQIALSRLALPDPARPSQVPYAALGTLLARATQLERAAGEDFQRTLPHERWLADRFGLLEYRTGAGATDDAPLAPYMLLADGGEPGTARWACVEPAHIQIARDHLVLIDPDTLGLTDDEAATLLEAARPSFDAMGIRVEAPTPRRWYVSGDALGELVAAPPLRAAGRSIEIWLPHDIGTGERSRAWMKLQNEVQMCWFEHPLNDRRESQGLPAVNGLWLYSQGTKAASLNQPFARVLSKSVATRGLGLASGATVGAPVESFAQLIRTTDEAGTTVRTAVTASPSAGPQSAATLVELDALNVPFIQQNWYDWHDALARLERDWFAPALAALRDGSLPELTLTLTGDTGMVSYAVTRGALRKFWRRRPLAGAITE